MRNENGLIRASDLILELGAFDLDNKSEQGKIQSSPSTIKIHKDWVWNANGYDDDIAVLELRNDVPVSQYIKPACMLTPSTDLGLKEGVVVGWGASSDATKVYENLPKAFKVPFIESNDVCYYKDNYLAAIGVGSFCAVQTGAATECLADSGNGLFVRINNRYYLKGVVSTSLNPDGDCYTENVSVYTDVSKYAAWIGTVKAIEASITCGVMSTTASLVIGGKTSTREQFPWIVSIFKKENRKFVHSGAGTMVSDKHVVSDATSVSLNNLAVSVGDLKLFLGTNQFDKTIQAGAVMQEGVLKITIHPNADYGSPSTADIAVITLKTPIIFSKFISPICLWDFDAKIDHVVGQVAYGVGYGKDQSGKITGIKKHVPLTIDSQENCKNTFVSLQIPDLARKYFCASGRVNNIIGKYDTPLYLKVTDKWYLRGLINLRFQVADDDKEITDSSKPLLYENIAVYTNWIQNQIK